MSLLSRLLRIIVAHVAAAGVILRLASPSTLLRFLSNPTATTLRPAAQALRYRTTANPLVLEKLLGLLNSSRPEVVVLAIPAVRRHICQLIQLPGLPCFLAQALDTKGTPQQRQTIWMLVPQGGSDVAQLLADRIVRSPSEVNDRGSEHAAVAVLLAKIMHLESWATLMRWYDNLAGSSSARILALLTDRLAWHVENGRCSPLDASAVYNEAGLLVFCGNSSRVDADLQRALERLHSVMPESSRA